MSNKKVLRKGKGIGPLEFFFYLSERKKELNKSNKHVFKSKACFETFSEKCKENDLHREYRPFGGPAENLSSTISQIEQNL